MVPSNNPDTNPLANTGVIAVGAQRLLPIFQQMYAAYSSVNNSKELISKINYRLKAKLDYKTDKIFDDIDNEIGIDSLQISSSGKNYLQFREISILSNKINCVLGKSGSGKSTLLRSIVGLEELSSGEIKINQTVVASPNISPLMYRDFIENVAYVPQDSPCVKGTIIENMTLSEDFTNLTLNCVKICYPKLVCMMIL